MKIYAVNLNKSNEIRAKIAALYGYEKTSDFKSLANKGTNALRYLFSSHFPTTNVQGWKKYPVLVAKQVGEMGRQMIFGDPLTLRNQIKDLYKVHGSMPKAIGSYMLNHYWRTPSPNLGGLLSGALQAQYLYQTGKDIMDAIKTEDPNIRRGNIAATLTGIVASPFTSRLGVAGSFLHSKLTEGARRLVQKPTPPAQPINLTNAAKEHLLATGRGLRTSYDIEKMLANSQGSQQQWSQNLQQYTSPKDMEVTAALKESPQNLNKKYRNKRQNPGTQVPERKSKDPSETMNYYNPMDLYRFLPVSRDVYYIQTENMGANRPTAITVTKVDPLLHHTLTLAEQMRKVYNK
jgi:hypothetical protein